MPVKNRVAVIREMAPYFNESLPSAPASLLQAVRLAVEDIKKEEPSVTGLNIVELSFLRTSTGEITLMVYFE